MSYTGWQPIETAPTSGVEVLLFTRWPGDGSYPCDPFDAVQVGAWVQGEWYMQRIGSPTHWMPLPGPPNP